MKAQLFRSALLLVLAVSMASAQRVPDPITDRPGRTESATVVPVGAVQLEIGAQYVNDYYRWTSSYPTTLIRIGVMDDLEFRFTGEYIHDRYQIAYTMYVDQGIGGVSAGAKLHLARENGLIPETAFIGHFLLPVGSRLFRTSNVAPGFRFAFAHSLGDVFRLAANVGEEWTGNNGSGAAVYTLAVLCEPWEHWTGHVEAYGAMWGDGRPSHLLEGGISVQANPNLQFDASFALPFTERGPDYYASTGLAVRLAN